MFACNKGANKFLIRIYSTLLRTLSCSCDRPEYLYPNPCYSLNRRLKRIFFSCQQNVVPPGNKTPKRYFQCSISCSGVAFTCLLMECMSAGQDRGRHFRGKIAVCLLLCDFSCQHEEVVSWPTKCAQEGGPWGTCMQKLVNRK